MRKHDPKDIHLQLCNIEAFENSQYSGVVLDWDSDIGFGQYIIYRQNGSDQWEADSECMDSNEDRAFLEQLLKDFIWKLKIVG